MGPRVNLCLFVLNDMMGSIFVRFVDIGLIVDHHFSGWGRRGHNRMVVGFIATCTISAYHH